MKHSNVLDKNQDVLCHRDYAERVVASFAHQIQSEYYSGNISVSIEDIVLEHFSAPTHPETVGTPKSCTHHAVFHSFFSDYSKQDSSTTNSHRKFIIEFLNQCNIMSNTLSTIIVPVILPVPCVI